MGIGLGSEGRKTSFRHCKMLVNVLIHQGAPMRLSVATLAVQSTAWIRPHEKDNHAESSVDP